MRTGSGLQRKNACKTHGFSADDRRFCTIVSILRSLTINSTFPKAARFPAAHPAKRDLCMKKRTMKKEVAKIQRLKSHVRVRPKASSHKDSATQASHREAIPTDKGLLPLEVFDIPRTLPPHLTTRVGNYQTATTHKALMGRIGDTGWAQVGEMIGTGRANGPVRYAKSA